MRGKLSFLIGPSRSGKSTFVKKWIAAKDEDEHCILGRVVVCTDSIRKALHGQLYNKEAEPVVFSHKYIMIKTLVNDGFHVLNDGTNSTRTSIQRLLEIDENAQPIVIDTPLEICRERAIKLGQERLLPVIERHYRQQQELLRYGLDKVLSELRESIRVRWAK